jgi:DNA-binding transcriptional regulator YiaG
MKKFKSEAMKIIYEDAKDFLEDGFISKEEFLEYERACTISNAKNVPRTSAYKNHKKIFQILN